MVGGERVDDGSFLVLHAVRWLALPSLFSMTWPASIIPDCCILFSSSSSSLIVSASHAAERARQYKPSTLLVTLSREGKRKGCGLLRGDTFGAAPRRALGGSIHSNPIPSNANKVQSRYSSIRPGLDIDTRRHDPIPQLPSPVPAWIGA